MEKMRVQKVFVMVEKIGAKEKYEGKIKVVGERKSFMASAVAYDKITLLKILKDIVDREIAERKGKEEAKRKRVLK